jgi:type I restriction enzyme M protein
MFEQTFKNIDDILHKDAGCGSELDYVEQTSWVLFLKYLDDLEKDKATAAELTGKTYSLKGQPINGFNRLIIFRYIFNI